MKYLILFVLLAGCQNAMPEQAVVRAESDLEIFADKNHGVVCYSKRYNSDTLSCLQLKD